LGSVRSPRNINVEAVGSTPHCHNENNNNLGYPMV
jgi:hypothetical protein